MFELNFRDERYLPFEYAGVISRWRIDMPKDCNAFDLDSFSDVIIKPNYTVLILYLGVPTLHGFANILPHHE